MMSGSVHTLSYLFARKKAWSPSMITFLTFFGIIRVVVTSSKFKLYRLIQESPRKAINHDLELYSLDMLDVIGKLLDFILFPIYFYPTCLKRAQKGKNGYQILSSPAPNQTIH
jgi:hypothetical protein